MDKTPESALLASRHRYEHTFIRQTVPRPLAPPLPSFSVSALLFVSCASLSSVSQSISQSVLYSVVGPLTAVPDQATWSYLLASCLPACFGRILHSQRAQPTSPPQVTVKCTDRPVAAIQSLTRKATSPSITVAEQRRLTTSLARGQKMQQNTWLAQKVKSMELNRRKGYPGGGGGETSRQTDDQNKLAALDASEKPRTPHAALSRARTHTNHHHRSRFGPNVFPPLPFPVSPLPAPVL
ncbi:hypothetical protein VDGL01_08808 [Verticillium dahliae]